MISEEEANHIAEEVASQLRAQNKKDNEFFEEFFTKNPDATMLEYYTARAETRSR